ncbi:MAG: hypothetical protein HUK22_02865, partial [Thermoguttaceae bacterium]|nr:hypothetical protein [Thermoguttaceae bacterium]
MRHSNARQKLTPSRRLRFETLETRRLLAVDVLGNGAAAPGASDAWYELSSALISPSAQEQEALEQINRFRADPQGELERIFSVATKDELVARDPNVAAAVALYSYPRDSIETFLNEWSELDSAAPLAYNPSLQQGAANHRAAMESKNVVSHRVAGEKALADRLADVGFQSGLTTEEGAPAVGECVAGGLRESSGFSVASYMLASFAVDWGVPEHTHRDTLLNADYCEIGISLKATTRSNLRPNDVVCDFGTSVESAKREGAYLLGVVYDDLDEDLFYDVGEGVGAATIVVERLDGSGETVEFASMEAGGYQIFLANGSYKITVSGGGFNYPVTKRVSIGGANCK